MEPQDNVLESLKIQVKRSNNKVSANEIRIKLTIDEKYAKDYKFKDFSKEDLCNFTLIKSAETESKEKLGILKFDAYLIFKKQSAAANGEDKPEKEYKIKKENPEDFQFDNSENSLLLVQVFADGIRPTGTKRKVVTYEDTDIIDETIKP